MPKNGEMLKTLSISYRVVILALIYQKTILMKKLISGIDLNRKLKTAASNTYILIETLSNYGFIEELDKARDNLEPVTKRAFIVKQIADSQVKKEALEEIKKAIEGLE